MSDTSELRIPSEYCAASSERFATGKTEVIELPPPRAPRTIPVLDVLVVLLLTANITCWVCGVYA